MQKKQKIKSEKTKQMETTIANVGDDVVDDIQQLLDDTFRS